MKSVSLSSVVTKSEKSTGQINSQASHSKITASIQISEKCLSISRLALPRHRSDERANLLLTLNTKVNLSAKLPGHHCGAARRVSYGQLDKNTA
jgi:hypothetical protein